MKLRSNIIKIMQHTSVEQAFKHQQNIYKIQLPTKISIRGSIRIDTHNHTYTILINAHQ